MQLNTSLAIDHSSSGFADAKGFGFEMNAMAFHAVIDGIYSDKVEAPVREYCTNAWDAHQMAGTPDRPFQVQAPSVLNPYFRVRDFGPGMTHDEIMNRATTMFASDKRDTNGQVGMLGLGMKSAFAYTDLYTITAFDGRTKRVYNCYMDAGSMPTVASLPVEICTEPAGIEISLPVKTSDVQRFQTAITKVMIGFSPMPTILNETFKPDRPSTIISGENYRVVEHSQIKRPFVQQGCVLYPLDVIKIHEDHDDWDASSFLTLPLIMDMPIGTVSVSTSREQIGYDEVTIQNLREAFHGVLKSTRANLETSFNAIDDYHEACSAYAATPEILLKIANFTPVWRNLIPLRKGFTFDGRKGADVRATFLPEGTWSDNVRWVGRAPAMHPGRRWERIPLLTTPARLQGAVIAHQQENLTGGARRIKTLIGNRSDRAIIWVQGDLMKAMKMYGIGEVIDLSTIEPKKPERNPRAPRKQGIRKTDVRNFDKYRTLERDVDLDEGGIYVFTDGARYLFNGEDGVYFETIQRDFLRPAENLGLLPDGVRALVATQRNVPKKHKGWVRLEDHLKAATKAFDRKAYAHQLDRRRVRHNQLWCFLVKNRDKLPKRLGNFVDKVEGMGGEEISYSMAAFWAKFHNNGVTPEASTKLFDQFEKLLDLYPLLDMASRSQHADHYLNLIRR